MGSKAVGRGAAHFTDVCIPANHLLGEVGNGFAQVMQGFDFSRALIGLQCVGLARVTLDETWAYVSRREAFDQPLGKPRAYSFPLAEAETLLSAARLSAIRRYGSRSGSSTRGAGRHVQVVGAEDSVRDRSELPAAAWTVRLSAPISRSSSACGTCLRFRSATEPPRS